MIAATLFKRAALALGTVLLLQPGAALRAQSLQPSTPVVDSSSKDAHASMPSVVASRIASGVRLDGRLDDAVWHTVAPATEFIQTEPREGEPATERTEVRFAFDDEALYIGARMFDSKGDVRTRLARRDAFVEGSDFLYIILDSHHDHVAAYEFAVNPSGVKRDQLNTGSMRPDDSWDAVWDLATSIDDQGWTAEIRIPFSQLRFSNAAEQVWGVQIQRRIVRNQEVSVLAFTPKRERGGVARYGHLVGMRELKRGRPIEVMPYTVGRAEYANVDRLDPFRSERETFAGAGVDLKYRLTSSLTLDGTINPDFGQVELDPATVNLTAFETSFQEKRPFFVEGQDIFGFGETGFGGNGRLFYSRRIGRSPQGAMPSGTKYADRPDASTILSAAKLSGRTANGWNLGFLEAVTDREQADFVLEDGTRGRQIVEPFTNYLVARAKKNMRGGQSALGFIGTAVNRRLETEDLESVLRSNAYVAGADFSHEFWNRTWSAQGFLAVSHVLGSESAMLRTQRSSSRYFQRPDADYVEIDSSATSMTGLAGRFEVGKRAGLHWRGEANVSFTSPTYEINDAGFQTSVDRINIGGNLTYVEQRPGNIFRDYRISLNPGGEWNHGHEFQGGRVGLELNGQFKNYWGGNINLSYSAAGFDDRLTRGGPSARELPGRHVGWNLNSDNRKRVSGRIRGNYSWGESGGFHLGLGGNVTLRPASNWSISAGPSYNDSRTAAQYLTSVGDTLMQATYGRRYLFAPINQTSLSMETRLNVNFSPSLSFDLFAQPFISTGQYGLPMQLRRPASFEFDKFSPGNGTLVEGEDDYTIDPDANGPANSFSLSKRDFNTRSLRGNAVMRWEWRPGSTLFLVWQQTRSRDESLGNFRFGRDVSGLFAAKPENVFMVKLSYWLNP